MAGELRFVRFPALAACFTREIYCQVLTSLVSVHRRHRDASVIGVFGHGRCPPSQHAGTRRDRRTSLFDQQFISVLLRAVGWFLAIRPRFRPAAPEPAFLPLAPGHGCRVGLPAAWERRHETTLMNEMTLSRNGCAAVLTA